MSGANGGPDSGSSTGSFGVLLASLASIVGFPLAVGLSGAPLRLVFFLALALALVGAVILVLAGERRLLVFGAAGCLVLLAILGSVLADRLSDENVDQRPDEEDQAREDSESDDVPESTANPGSVGSLCADGSRSAGVLVFGTVGPSPRITIYSSAPAPSGVDGLDPDARGNYLVYVDEARSELRIVELDSGRTVATRTFDGVVLRSPSITEDGEIVVFVAETSAGSVLLSWQHQSDEMAVLQDPSEQLSSPAVSNDGRLIAWTEGQPTRSQVVVGEVAAGSAPVIARWDGADPAWSPDGKWLAYVGPHNNGQAVFSRSVDSGSTTRLSDPVDALDSSPVWSPDCTHVTFIRTALSQTSIWSVSDRFDDAQLLEAGGVQTSVTYGWS